MTAPGRTCGVGRGRDVRRRSEVRGRRSEVGGQRSEVKGRRSEVGGRRSEVGGQRSEVRGQRSKVGGQRAGLIVATLSIIAPVALFGVEWLSLCTIFVQLTRDIAPDLDCSTAGFDVRLLQRQADRLPVGAERVRIHGDAGEPARAAAPGRFRYEGDSTLNHSVPVARFGSSPAMCAPSEPIAAPTVKLPLRSAG